MERNEQLARFAARRHALRNAALSSGAARLFDLLDDEAKGARIVPPLKQRKLAAMMGGSVRALQRRLTELEKAGYLKITRTLIGNKYEFVRKQTTEMAHSDATRMSQGMRQDWRDPSLLNKYQGNTQEPPTPFRESEPENPACPQCGGCGEVITERIQRGYGVTVVQPCACGAQRRSA